MAEIIKRKTKAEKITIDVDWNTNVQIAINNWGHLTIRIWKNTDEEKNVRNNEIQKATKYAIEVPFSYNIRLNALFKHVKNVS